MEVMLKAQNLVIQMTRIALDYSGWCRLAGWLHTLCFFWRYETYHSLCVGLRQGEMCKAGMLEDMTGPMDSRETSSDSRDYGSRTLSTRRLQFRRHNGAPGCVEPCLHGSNDIRGELETPAWRHAVEKTFEKCYTVDWSRRIWVSLLS